MAPNLGIPEINLQKSNSILCVVLSYEMRIFVKTKKFQKNVTGESYIDLHKLFEAQYKELDIVIDLVAERIRKLGGKTIGTMNEFSMLSRRVEHPNEHPDQKAMLIELLSDHETIIAELKKDIVECANENQDVETANLLSGIAKQHEAIFCLLRKNLN